MPEFLKMLLPAFVAALVGAGGAYIGAYTGSSTQETIWRKEKIYQYTMHIMEKRLEIIRQLSVALTDAQRAKYYDSWTGAKRLAILLKLQNCITTDKQPSTAECEFKQSDELTLKYWKDMSDMQANLQSAVMLANLYFCEKTHEALKLLQKGNAPWWEISNQEVGLILTAMQNESTCKLRPEEMFK